ncbi:hypothetical protein PIB30_008186 [Stylosanthes scabra]|uniref:Secreted protein n=1 Tax=Stylosanthes scabra TaxID=79078 RepID=A0ABU6Z1K6_9FABA|nr:hypothetical protein [Stylosanthes scabra]
MSLLPPTLPTIVAFSSLLTAAATHFRSLWVVVLHCLLVMLGFHKIIAASISTGSASHYVAAYRPHPCVILRRRCAVPLPHH